MLKRLAIIGAYYPEKALVQKVVSMDIETHVFACTNAADVAPSANLFYPLFVLGRDAGVFGIKNNFKAWKY